MAETRHGLGSGEIRPADESAQAAISRRVPSQQDEVRAALPIPYATQILLHRIAATRQPGSHRARPCRETLSAPRVIV